MKVFSHLYQDIISLESLYSAWGEFKKGKRKRYNVGFFERHLEDNIFRLHTELTHKTYRHSAYSAFYIRDPKTRHIHKANVRDRIVHHALFRVFNPLFEPTFIADSFSCRKGYGTHKGFRKLITYTRKGSQNYTKECWALKCDVKKYYDSIDHKILLQIMGKRIQDTNVLWLLEEIISSFGEKKGVPIGNLTSQFFANIYLNELDQFVKHQLKVKYYLRYADDFILLHSDKKYLVSLIKQIEGFLAQALQLSLHPNKVSLRKLYWGIDFVGYVALPHYTLVRAKTKRRALRRIRKKIVEYTNDSTSQQQLYQTVQSYLGLFNHAFTYKIEQDIKNFLWYELNLQ